MADFRITLGGTISACTTDEMNSALGAMKGEILAAGKRPGAIMRPLTQSVTVPNLTSGQTVQLKLGRPSSGRIWTVTRVVVLGADDNSAVTNMVAALYVGDESNVGLSQCVRHGQTFPWTTTENERAYVVHDREDLFVRFIATGATTVAQVTANALAWEYRDSDIDAQVI